MMTIRESYLADAELEKSQQLVYQQRAERARESNWNDLADLWQDLADNAGRKAQHYQALADKDIDGLLAYFDDQCSMRNDQ